MTREELEKLADLYLENTTIFDPCSAFIAGALMMRDKIVDMLIKEANAASQRLTNGVIKPEQHHVHRMGLEIKELGEDK